MTYQPQIYSSPLEKAIERHSLTVTPRTSLAEVLRMMSKLQNTSKIPGMDVSTEVLGNEESPLWNQGQTSCVLVVENTSVVSLNKSTENLPKSPLIGIFGNRDIVRLIANGTIARYQSSFLKNIPISEAILPNPIALTESDDRDLFAVLSLFGEHNIDRLPILNANGSVAGLLTPERIRQVLIPSNILKLKKVNEVTIAPITAPPHASLLEISQLISQHQVSCIVITEIRKIKLEKSKPEGISIVHHSFLEPVGIITDGDIVQALFLELDLATTPAYKVMKTRLTCLKPTDSLWVAHKQMLRQQEKLLVVSGQQGELQGIVTQIGLLGVLDPTEMHKTVKRLQHSVYQLQAEKLELLQTRNEQLEKEVQERTASLQQQLECDRLLAQIALRIHQSLNLDEILNAAVVEVQQFLKTDRVVLYRIDPPDVATVVAESVADGWRSWLGNMLPSIYLLKMEELSDNNDIQAVADTQQCLSAFASSDQSTGAFGAEEKKAWLQEQQIQAYLLVPIVLDGELWGVMSTHQCVSTREWQPSEINLLRKLATQLAIAIQQAQLYQQVQTLNTDLGKQVKERTAELEQKVQELEKLHVIKDDFLSTVSHDLRAPLANMKIAIHNLKTATTSKEGKQSYLSILENECLRETELINDLLDLQKLETGIQAITLEEVNLSTWLPTIIEPFQGRICARKQTLRVEFEEELLIINSHPDSLRRVLTELLNNGCKYTANGGEIVVKVEFYWDSSEEKIKFFISNQAEIPAEELPKIFDKFYRVPKSDRWQQGGTGLGLALVKKLVEQLGGELQVVSQDGWTTFTVELPAE